MRKHLSKFMMLTFILAALLVTPAISAAQWYYPYAPGPYPYWGWNYPYYVNPYPAYYARPFYYPPPVYYPPAPYTNYYWYYAY